MANVSDDLIPLGKDDDGEVFVIKSSISYHKLVGLKKRGCSDFDLWCARKFWQHQTDKPKFQSATYQFFANCPIDIHEPKLPLQGSMGMMFAKKNAQGKHMAIMKDKNNPYFISNTMAVISHVAVCNHVATHAIPTIDLDFSAR